MPAARRPARLMVATAMIVVVVAASGLAAPSQVAKLRAKEFAYEPKEVVARPGDIVFDIENTGVIEHNFVLEDAAKTTIAKIAVISPGEAEQVRVTLRTGTYTGYCDLPGHREAGMWIPIRVRD